MIHAMSTNPATPKRLSKTGKDISGLKMWKKGQSGNPKGVQARDAGLKSLLLNRLDYIVDDLGRKPRNPNRLTWRERLVNSLLRQAEDGHPVAIKEIWERLEGKVVQAIDVHVETEKWQRLNEGRMRLSASVTTETRTSIVTGDQVQVVSETRSIEYDGPAVDAVSDPVIEAAVEEAEDSEIPWL